MRNLNPRHRVEALASKSRAPEEEHERSLYVLLHGVEALNKACPYRLWEEGTAVAFEVAYALEVYKNDFLRSVLEPFLVGSTNDMRVSEALELTPNEVYAYRFLFFDTTALRNQLEKIAYIRSLPEGDAKNLFLIAHNEGIDSLQWQYCSNKGNVSPQEVQSILMRDALHRFKSGRTHDINSKAAKESLKYAGVAATCAKTLMENDSLINADIANLEIQFTKKSADLTVDELTADGVELLH